MQLAGCASVLFNTLERLKTVKVAYVRVDLPSSCIELMILSWCKSLEHQQKKILLGRSLSRVPVDLLRPFKQRCTNKCSRHD